MVETKEERKKRKLGEATARWRAKNVDHLNAYREANRERNQIRDRATTALRLSGLVYDKQVKDLWCSGCKSHKAAELYSLNWRHRSGRANWCKACTKKLWQRPEYVARRKEKRDLNWSHALTIECRLRAKKRGLPFNITKDDLVVPEFCPVLGIKLVPRQGRLAPDSPSVDRRDPTKGYVSGNVAVISWLANRIKSDCGDPAVFEAIAAYIRRGADADHTNRPRIQAASAVYGVPQENAALGLSSRSSAGG